MNEEYSGSIHARLFILFQIVIEPSHGSHFHYSYCISQTYTAQNPAGRTDRGIDLDAYELFYSMMDQSIDMVSRELYVVGTDRSTPITFGAEKEGSSSKILRVMSPSDDLLKQILRSELAWAKQVIPLLLTPTSWEQKPVYDKDNKLVVINQEALIMAQAVDWNQYFFSEHFSAELWIQYKEDIAKVVNIFGDSPFSLLKKEIRKKLWEAKKNDIRYLRFYDSWVPLKGDPEKYILEGHQELNGRWEVICKPQNTYGDFEKQILWFRTLMGSKTHLFEAPGHNRVVMPLITLLPEELKVFEDKAGELNRMVLAYIVLRGVKGQTGILRGKHKAIPSESSLADLVTGRGPIRLERNRFYKNSIGLEFREETYKKALVNWGSARTRHDKLVSLEYLLPAWAWWRAPFLKGKEIELKRLSREFFEALASMENPTYDKISKLSSNWVTASNLIADIENYMTPKKGKNRVSSPLLVKIKDGGIDVNKIDLGNEFTARMPLKLKADYDNTGKWVQTIADMTPEERENRIHDFALKLQINLGGPKQNVSRLGVGSHGHSLSIAYELLDSQNRTWRVEWDGVGRNYDSDGNIILETARGGHIEIVSPKYNPSLREIEAVYSTMKSQSLVPDYKMGGSHINIDLAAFDNNPKALARFLTIFHQNRGIISFMFQHINRLRSAEPVEISENLDRRLRNFQGTDEDLAKLLYNEKYFNPRQNRKTRYTQIDVSNYMGQIIPEEFIKPDFDVVKARFTHGENWSRQFRVTKHRKLEFRLFDAAKDSLEASLQIKIVRAMLNKALNENLPLVGSAQTVDHESYVKDPPRAYADLNRTVQALGLDYLDYSQYVTNKLIINKAFISGKYYRNWFKKARAEFPVVRGWGEARQKMRRGSQVIYSDSLTAAPQQAIRAFFLNFSIILDSPFAFLGRSFRDRS